MPLKLSLFVVIGLFVLSACQSDQEPSSQSMALPPAFVSLQLPREGQLSQTTALLGNLQASQQVIVSSEKEGVVQNIFIKDGQQVQAGDSLVQLSNETALAELKRAEADVKLRQGESDRARSLQKRNVNSQYDVDKALAQLDTALANQAMAKAELDKRLVKAPFSGRLGIRKVNLGEYVKEGDPLIEVVNLSTLFVDFEIPETQLSYIEEGQMLELTANALANKRFSVKVLTISPTVEISSRSIRVRALVDNAQANLKPGMFSKVHLPIQALDNVFWLPETAVIQNGSDHFVLLSLNGKSQKERVQVLAYEEGEVALTSSGKLGKDTQVVVAGHHKVAFDGMPIVGQ